MSILEIPIITYALWPLAIIVVMVLWVVALLEIKSQRSSPLFTNAVLASMVAAISVVAISAVVSVTAAFPPSWEKTTPVDATATVTCPDLAESYVFSFGFEYAVCRCSACEREEGHQFSKE